MTRALPIQLACPYVQHRSWRCEEVGVSKVCLEMVGVPGAALAVGLGAGSSARGSSVLSRQVLGCVLGDRFWLSSLQLGSLALPHIM